MADFTSTLGATKAALSLMFVIFGAVIGIIEFLIRDEEIERIRNFFIAAWLELQRFPKSSFVAIIRNRYGHGALVAFAWAYVVCINAFAFYLNRAVELKQRKPEADPLADLASTVQSPRELAVAIGTLLLGVIIPVGFFYLIRRRLYAYVGYCLAPSSALRCLLRLSIVPLIAAVLTIIFAAIFITLGEDHLVSKTLSKALAVVEYIVCLPLGYCWGLALVFLLFYIIYLLLTPILFVAERLCLRIAETSRGPVLTIAAIVAFMGVALNSFI